MKRARDFSDTIKGIRRVAGAANPDARLIAACDAYLALDEGFDHPATRLATPEELGEVRYALIREIARLTPKTALGRRCLAEVAICLVPCGEPEWRILHVLLWNVARDYQ